jgi:hypothetical protein
MCLYHLVPWYLWVTVGNQALLISGKNELVIASHAQSLDSGCMHSGRRLLVTYLGVPLDYLTLRGACEDVLTSLEPLDGK